MTSRRRPTVEGLAWGLETTGPVCLDHLVMVIIADSRTCEGYLPWSREVRFCVLAAFEVRNTSHKPSSSTRSRRPAKPEKMPCR